MKNQKLLETIADISFIAGEANFFSGDSRADVSNFILWAKEFQLKNSKTNWGETDYRIAIERFTADKLNAN